MVKNTFLHSCRQIIYSLLLLFMASMFVISLFLTVHVNAVDGSTELISYTAPSLVGSLAAIVIFIIFHRLSVKLLERMPILPGSAAMLILWGLCAFAFIAATNLSQMYDYQYVLEIGKLFGQSRFSAMRSEYLNAYPFQLGICLFIEFISRCFPSFDTGLLLQLLNVASCLVASGALCAISYLLWKQDGLRSCVTLCATSVPVLLFCEHIVLCTETDHGLLSLYSDDLNIHLRDCYPGHVLYRGLDSSSAADLPLLYPVLQDQQKPLSGFLYRFIPCRLYI